MSYGNDRSYPFSEPPSVIFICVKGGTHCYSPSTTPGPPTHTFDATNVGAASRAPFGRGVGKHQMLSALELPGASVYRWEPLTCAVDRKRFLDALCAGTCKYASSITEVVIWLNV